MAVTLSAFWSGEKVFNPVSLGSESSSTRTQRMAFSAAVLPMLTSHNRVFNPAPFPFKETFCFLLCVLNAALLHQSAFTKPAVYLRKPHRATTGAQVLIT